MTDADHGKTFLYTHPDGCAVDVSGLSNEKKTEHIQMDADSPVTFTGGTTISAFSAATREYTAGVEARGLGGGIVKLTGELADA